MAPLATRSTASLSGGQYGTAAAAIPTCFSLGTLEHVRHPRIFQIHMDHLPIKTVRAMPLARLNPSTGG